MATALTPVPSFLGCPGLAPQVRPRSIVVACGDGNFYLDRLKWSHWSAKVAVADGLGHQNDCRPDCVRGRFHVYAVTVRLTRPEVCRAGRLLFTRFSYSFVASKPVGSARTNVLTAPFYVHSGCR